MDYVIAPVNIDRRAERFLVVADHGGWVELGKEDFRRLITGTLADERVRSLVEKAGVILTERNATAVVQRYRERLRHLFEPTRLHVLAPTLRCNCRCVYCHSAARSASENDCDMQPETAERVVDFILSSPAKDIIIEFQGGDSSLRPDLVRHIVEYAIDKNRALARDIRFAMVTNLVNLPKEFLEHVGQRFYAVCTSLDGPKDVHDAHRKTLGGRGTYDTVRKNILELRRRGIPIWALMVTTRRILGRHRELVSEYLDLGMHEIQVKWLDPMGYARDEAAAPIGITPDEFIGFWRDCVETMLELSAAGVSISERFARLIAAKILTPNDPGFLDFRSPCGLAAGQLAYDHRGDIYTCDEARVFERFRLGNVHTDQFGEVVAKAKDLVRMSINQSISCDRCVYQPYCGVCPVLAYAESGSPRVDPPRHALCKIRKAQFDFVFDKILTDKTARRVFSQWATTDARA